MMQACAGQSQSPIDIPASPGTGDAVLAESEPLLFSNYEQVRAFVLANDVEHNRIGINRIENGEVKNNGHTAVS